MNVGERIRELRKAKGLSTRQLANVTNISQPVISRLETNSRIADIASIEIICKALGVTLGEFFVEDRQILDPELQQLLETAKKLSPEQRMLVQKLLETMGKG
ncbi:MAG: helix-turn-helix transcriptional regulator [Negativicutes bacterium]|nr:helix-turn-helix transcriptional regulator [Negativicutes bacterium]